MRFKSVRYIQTIQQNDTMTTEFKQKHNHNNDHANTCKHHSTVIKTWFEHNSSGTARANSVDCNDKFMPEPYPSMINAKGSCMLWNKEAWNSILDVATRKATIILIHMID